MYKTVAVIAIVGVVVLAQIEVDESLKEDAADDELRMQIQYNPGGGRHRAHGPSYLLNVTREARMEYFSILRNAALTIAQQKVEIGAWADRNGVAEQLSAFNLNGALMKEEIRQNITQLISELPYAVQRMQEIEDNEKQTYAQQSQALRNLMMENPILYHAAKFVSDLFTRRCCGGRGGPRGPGKQIELSFAGSDEGLEGE